MVLDKVEIGPTLYGPIQVDVETRGARELLGLIQLARVLERLRKVDQIVSERGLDGLIGRIRPLNRGHVGSERVELAKLFDQTGLGRLFGRSLATHVGATRVVEDHGAVGSN